MTVDRLPSQSNVASHPNATASELGGPFGYAEEEPGIELAKCQFGPHHIQANAQCETFVQPGRKCRTEIQRLQFRKERCSIPQAARVGECASRFPLIA